MNCEIILFSNPLYQSISCKYLVLIIWLLLYWGLGLIPLLLHFEFFQFLFEFINLDNLIYLFLNVPRSLFFGSLWFTLVKFLMIYYASTGFRPRYSLSLISLDYVFNIFFMDVIVMLYCQS